MATEEGKSTNVNIIVGVIALIVIICVLAYFVGRSIGRKQPPKNTPLPDDNNPGTLGEPISPTEQVQLNSIDNAIHSNIKGLNWVEWVTFQEARDDTPFQDALNLSDRLLTGLWNTYKNTFYDEDQETLTQAIHAEYMSSTMYALYKRLLNLNLK